MRIEWFYAKAEVVLVLSCDCPCQLSEAPRNARTLILTMTLTLILELTLTLKTPKQDSAVHTCTPLTLDNAPCLDPDPDPDPERPWAVRQMSARRRSIDTPGMKPAELLDACVQCYKS
jgi:hypothetical protein